MKREHILTYDAFNVLTLAIIQISNKYHYWVVESFVPIYKFFQLAVELISTIKNNTEIIFGAKKWFAPLQWLIQKSSTLCISVVFCSVSVVVQTKKFPQIFCYNTQNKRKRAITGELSKFINSSWSSKI